MAEVARQINPPAFRSNGGLMAQPIPVSGPQVPPQWDPFLARARQAAQLAPDTTVAVLVTGARPEFSELQHAALYFPPEVSIVALRVDPTTPAGITGLQRLVVLNLPQLSGLRALLSGAGT